MRIAVVGNPGGWSSEHLADTVANRTGERHLVNLENACLTEDGRVVCDGLDLTAVDAVLIKKIGPAYSPNHLDRLEVLRVVQSRGIPMISRPERIAGVLNRLSCTVTLRVNGIPMPPTVVTENPAQAQEAVKRFGRAVLKPLYSTKARGMRVVEPDDDVAAEVAAFQSEGNEMMYVQKMMDLPDRDYGVVFLGGDYLATYARVRQKDAWSTSTSAGGRYAPAEPGTETIELARRAQEPFGLDFTCVDVAETPQGPVVFEVSAFGGFRGLREAHGMDVADRLVTLAMEAATHVV